MTEKSESVDAAIATCFGALVGTLHQAQIIDGESFAALLKKIAENQFSGGARDYIDALAAGMLSSVEGGGMIKIVN